MRAEIKRKLFHLFGFIYVLGLAKLSRPHFINLVLIVWVVEFLFELFRLKIPFIRQRFNQSFGFLLRDEEKNHFSGVIWMILGVLASALLLEEFSLAATPILYLLLGDAVASLVGKGIQGPKWPQSKKSISGSTACFLVCLLVGWYMLYPRYGWSPVVLGALVATVVEYGFIPINDNFSIPFFLAVFFKLWL